MNNYDSLPHHVYYDASIINNDQSGTKPPPRLNFQDIRSTPVLSSPELYELSVVRFNLQTANSLPIWIPTIQLDNILQNPNTTTYSFTMNYDFNDETYSSGQTFVTYIPTNRSEPIPVIGSLRDTNIPYYYVYSFNTIVTMLNNCLNEAFERLILDTGFSGVTLPTLNRPYFEWDNNAQKFILNADVIGFDNNIQNHISIHCNTALYTLISSFQAFYNGFDLYESKNYTFNLSKDTRGLNTFRISDTYRVIQLFQEYSTGALFTPISSIVFSTSLIPVLPSNTAKPSVVDGDGSLISTGNNNNISSMITDFEVQENSGYGFSGVLSYTPTAEYRMIDLNNSSSEKLNNLDITVYWKDQYSNLHPLYLQPGCKCDLKILFRKKKL